MPPLSIICQSVVADKPLPSMARMRIFSVSSKTSQTTPTSQTSMILTTSSGQFNTPIYKTLKPGSYYLHMLSGTTSTTSKLKLLPSILVLTVTESI
jgi:hypothetical protein